MWNLSLSTVPSVRMGRSTVHICGTTRDIYSILPTERFSASAGVDRRQRCWIRFLYCCLHLLCLRRISYYFAFWPRYQCYSAVYLFSAVKGTSVTRSYFVGYFVVIALPALLAHFSYTSIIGFILFSTNYSDNQLTGHRMSSWTDTLVSSSLTEIWAAHQMNALCSSKLEFKKYKWTWTEAAYFYYIAYGQSWF